MEKYAVNPKELNANLKQAVIGPLGTPLTLEQLPNPNTKRWVARRKAEVVYAYYGGLLSIDQVIERYSLTLEEFASWQRAVDRDGIKGLRITKMQHYRERDTSR